MLRALVHFSILLIMLLTVTAARTAAASSQPPQTGQKSCYTSAGNLLTCSGTGQDGELRAGIAWPGSRFTASSDGTISDALTGLVWLSSPATSGAMSWQSALDFVASSNALPSLFFGFNDWRLPTISELQSLLNRDITVPYTWLQQAGFQGLAASQFFWSATTTPSDTLSSETVSFETGLVSKRPKTDSGFAWLVRGPLPGSTLLIPRTGQTSCYTAQGVSTSCTGTGQDGSSLAGEPWPSPRFIPGNQMITDALTGLIWLKDANPIYHFNPDFDTDGTAGDGLVSWQRALDFVINLNTLTYLGYQDWRLPNIGELSTLLNAGEASSAAWLTSAGFTSIPETSAQFWSSTSRANAPSQAFILSLSDAEQINAPKNTESLVWPIRGGFWGSPVFFFTPSMLDFGTIVVDGAPVTKTFTIKNATTTYQNLVVNNLALTGDSPSDFTLVPGGAAPCSGMAPVLPPGSNCSYDVTFAPLSEGQKTAALTITTNAASDPYQVPVTGSAVDGTAPSGSFKINGGAAYVASTSVTLTVAASDNSGTVTDMRFSNNGSLWSDWIPYATTTPWTLSLIDGQKTVYAEFRDKTGNISIPVSAVVVLRSSPPTDVTIAGLPATSLTNASTLTLTVSGTNAVDYKYTLTPVAPTGATLSPAQDTFVPLKTQIVLTNLPEGNYTLQVFCRDIAGNQQEVATTASWTIDRKPPTLSITPGVPASPTNNPTPIISGKVEVGVQSVTVALGASPAQTAAVSGEDWQIALPALTAGSNTITITARDQATNSTTLQRIVVFDTTPPSALITGIPPKSSTVNSTSAFFTVYGDEVVAYKYKLDSNDYSREITVDIPITLSSLAEGDHSLLVMGRDSAGNWQAQPGDASKYAWKIDTVAPTFTLVTPSSPTKATSQDISIAAISEVGTIFNASNEAGYTSNAVISSSATAKITGFPLLQGTNRIVVTGRDSAGNTSASTIVIEADSFPPTAVIDSIITEGSIVTVPTPTFIIGGTGVSQYRYKLDKTSSPPTTGVYTTAAIDIGTPITLSNLADGNYTLSVLGRDTAGNEQTSPTTLSMFVDSTAPTVVVSGGPGSITSSTSASFIVDPTTGVVAYKYALDSGVYTGAEIDVNTAISLSGLSNGPHTLFLIGRDANGNWQKSPTAVTWTIQTTVPPITIDTLPTRTNKTRLTGTVERGSTVVIRLLNKSTNSATTANATVTTTTWSYNMSLATGIEYTATATATSAAGTTNSTSIDFTYDNTAPTVTITPVSPLPVPPDATGASAAVFRVTYGTETVSTIQSFTYKLDTGSVSASMEPGQLIRLTGLVTGTHVLSVTATDTSGNSGTATYTWAVDTALTPTALFVQSSLPDYKTNVTTANISLDTSVTKYKFVLSTKPSGTIIDPASPENTLLPQTTHIGLTTMPQGIYVLDVYGYDEVTALYQTYPTTVTWEVDTIAPSSVTVSGIPTGGLTNATTLSLTVSGSDLVFYKYLIVNPADGYVVTPTQDQDTSIATKINFTSLPEGPYTISIWGRDTAGNWQTSPTTANFTIDRIAPVVTLAPPETPTNTISQTLSGTFNDPTAVVTISANTEAVGGTALLDTAAVPPTWSFTVKGLRNGSNLITVKATDPAGNIGTTAATITLATNLPLAVVSGYPASITNQTSATLTVTGTNNVVNYKYRLDGGPYIPGGTDFAQSTPIATPITVSGLGEGEHTVQVIGRDIAGNWQEAPTTIAWIVDTTSPEAVLTPAALASPTSATSATFVVGGSEVVSYRYSFDNGPEQAEAKISLPIKLSGISSGEHTLTVTGKDMAGNWQNAGTATSVTWTVQTASPVITIDQTVPENPITASATFSMSGTAVSSASASIVLVRVENETTKAAANAILVGTTWSIDNQLLVPGTNRIVVTAIDSSGNAASKTAIFIRTTTQPTAVVLSGTPKSVSNANAASLTIGGADVVAYKYMLKLNSGSSSYSAEVSVSQKLLLSNLADGQYELSILGRDFAGTWQDEAEPTLVTWTVDTTSPTITFNPVTTPTRVADQRISGTVDPGSSVTISSDKGPIGGNAAVAGANWNFLLVGLSAGDNMITATATDAIGNTSSVSAIISLDAGLPVAIINGAPTEATRLTEVTLTISGDQVVTYSYSLDGGPYSGDITIGTPLVISGLTEGIHTLSVKGKKASGLAQEIPTTAEWSVVTALPVALISGVPPETTKLTSATLTISGTGVIAYRYSIDGSPYSTESLVEVPINLVKLTDGVHEISVIGRDQLGSWQVTPTRASWTIDTNPPTLTLNPVTARTSVTSQKLSGRLEPGATLTITSDTTAFIGAVIAADGLWNAQISQMPLGENNFTLTATDALGNISVIATQITVYAPFYTLISGVPTTPVNQTSFSFTISGTNVLAYKYSLDGGPYSQDTDISLPLELSNLPEGKHTLIVVGLDTVNLAETPPTRATWTIDLTPPQRVDVSGMPVSPTRTTLVSLTLSGDDVVTYRYRLDGGQISDFIPIATPLNLVSLADGAHRLEISGKDLAGNIQLSPTIIDWTVDTFPPVTTATPAGGIYTGTTTVTLTVSEDATIHYTTDGTTPSLSSPVFSAPLVLRTDTVVSYFSIDPAGNRETVQRQTYTFSTNGDINGDGVVDIIDVSMVLRYVINLAQPTAGELARMDVAPLGRDGKPLPDGAIDLRDCTIILKKAVGLLSW